MLVARVAVRVVAGWQPDLPMAVEQVVVRDMMIDGVAPSPGVRPLILSWPPAVIDGESVVARSDSALRELAAIGARHRWMVDWPVLAGSVP